MIDMVVPLVTHAVLALPEIVHVYAVTFLWESSARVPRYFQGECSSIVSVSSSFCSVSPQHLFLSGNYPVRLNLSGLYEHFVFGAVTFWNLCKNLFLTFHLGIVYEHRCRCVPLTPHFNTISFMEQRMLGIVDDRHIIHNLFFLNVNKKFVMMMWYSNWVFERYSSLCIWTNSTE
jgi:hypothetical protein